MSEHTRSQLKKYLEPATYAAMVRVVIQKKIDTNIYKIGVVSREDWEQLERKEIDLENVFDELGSPDGWDVVPLIVMDRPSDSLRTRKARVLPPGE